MTRFTPIVAMSWTREIDAMPAAASKRRSKSKSIRAKPSNIDEAELPAVLFLDVTGCERLFGGMPRLVAHVRASVRRLNIIASIAVAPTIGAAWAIAAFGPTEDAIVDASWHGLPARDFKDEAESRAGSPCHKNGSNRLLKSLPAAALRLPEEIILGLHHLGLVTVGQLLAMPREALPSRFGSALSMRLDQLLGTLHEPLVPLNYDVPVVARIELDGPIDALESIWLIFETLLRQIVDNLARRGHGARQIDLIARFDRTSRRPDVMRSIQLSRPTRQFKTLFNLVRCATERMDGGHEGFVAFAIKVPAHERIADEQADLIENESRVEAAEVDRLIERLRVRLGENAVIKPILIESYLPELAWKPQSESAPRTTTTPLLVQPSRPMHLLRMPDEIRVISEPSDERVGQPRQFTWRSQTHRLRLILGPERIAGEWWRGHQKTRDYYEVEDQEGLRFWIFRVATRVIDPTKPGEERVRVRWFLHGRFE